MPEANLTLTRHRKHADRYELHVDAPDHDLAEVPGLDTVNVGTDEEPNHVAVFTFAAHPGFVEDEDGNPILKRGKPVPTMSDEDYVAMQQREAALLVRHHVDRAAGKGQKLKGEGEAL